ncbi:MAG: hypothetical protein OHK0023_10530 [Anaerolineae bacterium]
MPNQAEGIAKITWDDPATLERREFVLVEGATASIGRSPDNDICIPERHVSRQHAVITFRDGIFTISDLGSANKTFVNDRQIAGPFPLQHGDVVRLYVPVLHFSAIVTEEEEKRARDTGTAIVPATGTGRPRLMITHGPQEGQEYTLNEDVITIGRQTADAAWEIVLNDRAVSRPHCRLSFRGNQWTLMDLGSANGTMLNGHPVTATPMPLKDGDVITAGETTLLFRMASAVKK